MKTRRDGLVVFLLLLAFYLWLVDQATLAETCAGALVALATAGVVARLARELPDRTRFGARLIAPLVRIPLAAVRESYELLVPLLWKRIAGKPVGGRWIALRYRDGGDGPTERGRRLFAVFASNLTPNALPLEIDEHRERFTQHQLVHRREPAASDPVFPV